MEATMFNKSARSLFETQIRKCLELPPGDLVASESELGYAAGMVAYARLREDIGDEEAALLNRRISSVRSNRVARLCRDNRMARA
jgi:hypothetical protein